MAISLALANLGAREATSEKGYRGPLGSVPLSVLASANVPRRHVFEAGPLRDVTPRPALPALRFAQERRNAFL